MALMVDMIVDYFDGKTPGAVVDVPYADMTLAEIVALIKSGDTEAVDYVKSLTPDELAGLTARVAITADGGYDDGKHPRDAHGHWIPTGGGDDKREAARARSREWMRAKRERDRAAKAAGTKVVRDKATGEVKKVGDVARTPAGRVNAHDRVMADIRARAAANSIHPGWTSLSDNDVKEVYRQKLITEGISPRTAAGMVNRSYFNMTGEHYGNAHGQTITIDADARISGSDKLELMRAMNNLTEKYPEVPIAVNVRADLGSASANAWATGGNGTMNLGPKVFQPSAQSHFEYDVRSGWWPAAAEGHSAIENTLTHEFGHNIDPKVSGRISSRAVGYYSKSYGPAANAYHRQSGSDEIIEKAMAKGPVNNALGGHWLDGTTQYGHTNDKEAYAEMFTEWTLSGGETLNMDVRALARSEGWR